MQIWTPKHDRLPASPGLSVGAGPIEHGQQMLTVGINPEIGKVLKEHPDKCLGIGFEGNWDNSGAGLLAIDWDSAPLSPWTAHTLYSFACRCS